MGCPGQARTIPRRNQPSQRCQETRRTAAATAIAACGTRPHAGRAKRGGSRNLVVRRMCIAARCTEHSHAKCCASPHNDCERQAASGRPPCASSAHAAVDHQSGPRPESRRLRQPALEGLTNSARTETPQRGGRNKSGEGAAALSDGGVRLGGEEGAGGGPRARARVCVLCCDALDTTHMILYVQEQRAIAAPTNQYNQDLGLIHSTNGNHLESPNEGSSIDHQETIHLHAQNITMFPTNETWYFASQMLVSSSGGLILILTAQSTRNEFRMHTDEMSPRRGPQVRRASGTGEYVRIPATNERSSEGAGSVSGEAPPMLKYHNLPLVPYVLMQLIKIKRLGPGKFYLSHKGDHAFIKGNPSSHKGWMSRFFFVRRVDRKRDPWKCDMSWRDNIFTLTPRTPERSPNLTSFLDAMREKSYNAPELIQEDLLCAFGFSRMGVELVGDLDERMGKAELVKAMQEEARASGEVGPPKKAARKRPAVSSAEEEAHREKRVKNMGASTSGTRPGESPKMTHEPTQPTRASEETRDLPPIITIPEALSLARGKGPERVLPFDLSKDSLVDSPTGVVATKLICNMVSDRDLPVLKGAEDIEAVGHFAANLTSLRPRSSKL
ncbi:hypothetical protein F511_20907 [Dorcoceras hygrometricum]|uniref:Uncharacterized protein n=1 Tax=Dorcoceras hygrometricum TaxID=472368 RepID=A0A2Z7AZB7_9LAMI|nr:hypothetical protein F511_20907 [Dorcoceras hygrometricum]